MAERPDIPDSLQETLLRLDGQVGVVVDAEKHMIDPPLISGDVAGELERVARQMGLGTAGEVVGQSDAAQVFPPAKPGFTREAGSLRRQVSGR